MGLANNRWTALGKNECAVSREAIGKPTEEALRPRKHERLCVTCGKPLSKYNKSGECWNHQGKFYIGGDGKDIIG